jgi:CubicO group peptidase (beta-lactamase class C family)
MYSWSGTDGNHSAAAGVENGAAMAAPCPFFALNIDENPAHYSNTNYILLGTAIERAAEAPLADLIRDRLIEPLGIDGIALQSPSFAAPDTAHGYTAISRGTPHRDVSDGTSFVPNRRVSQWAWAAGGMAADARAVAIWADSLAPGIGAGVPTCPTRVIRGPSPATDDRRAHRTPLGREGGRGSTSEPVVSERGLAAAPLRPIP